MNVSELEPLLPPQPSTQSQPSPMFIFGAQAQAPPPAPPEASPPAPPEASPAVQMQAAPQAPRQPSIPRRHFLGFPHQGEPCEQNQGGLNAYYDHEMQNFTFPSCTLTRPKEGLPMADQLEIQDVNKHNIIFTRHPNLNMVVFEILIKLFDFAHDHIKSINRIAIVDADDFMRFIGNKQGEFNVENAPRGFRQHAAEAAAPEAAETHPSKKTKTEAPSGGAAVSPNNEVLARSPNNEVLARSPDNEVSVLSPDSNKSAHVFGKMGNLKSVVRELKEQSTEGVPEVTPHVKTDVAPEVTPDANADMLKKDILIFTNQMKENLSFVLTQIITFTTPELISKVKKNLPDETGDPNVDAVDNIENANAQLLTCFIIVINKLFTKHTGETTDNYLTHIYPDKVPDKDWVKLDNDELNEGNLQIKLMKLSIIQTLMQTLDEDLGSSFIKTELILKLFSREYFNSFFDIYLRNFVANCGKQNIVPLPNPTVIKNDTMIGGAINQNILNKLNRVLVAYATNRQQMTRFLNDQIFRVFTCNLLWSLNIIEKDPSQSAAIDAFRYTAFGNAIMDQQSNATNYYQLDAAGQGVTDLVPNNVSLPHPTLVILRYQLENLYPVWNQQLFEFRQYKHIEHVLDSTMYHYAKSINGFNFDLPPGILNSDVGCCPSAFIVSNAATTLNVGVPIQCTKNIPGYTVNGRDKCTMQTYSGILDPAGSMKIKFKEPYEYGNMNSNVVGNGFDGNLDRRVQFNGIINFVPGGQAAAAPQNCLLSNTSRNNINLNIVNGAAPAMNVSCNVNILYPNCEDYPNYDHANDSAIQRRFGNIIEAPELPSENIHYGPINPTLNEVRRNMLFTLVSDIVSMNILDMTKRGREQRGASLPIIDNLFINYYDRAIARSVNQDVRPGDHIDRLLSTTLNKTVGDLMQVLTVLTKYGGITDLHAIHSKVFPYNEDGHALREIAHHDLTASIITYFMLIFGGHEWRVNPVQAVGQIGGVTKFRKGAKSTKRLQKIAAIQAADDDLEEPESEDDDDVVPEMVAQPAQPAVANSDVSLAEANIYYNNLVENNWIATGYYNPGKNQGGYMSDHNLVRLGVGNCNEINNVINAMNGSLTECGRFGYFTPITRNVWVPPRNIDAGRNEMVEGGYGGSNIPQGLMGGRKTLRRRNKVARFTIREKKNYARKSRKFYRKKHKTRSLNVA